MYSAKDSTLLPSNNHVIIIGAGASGLLLLLALDELNYPHTVTLLERNPEPLNDRIWSFWDSDTLTNRIPQYIRAIFAKTWPSWDISVQNHSYKMNNSAFEYCALRSEDLSTLVHKKISENPLYNIIYDCEVTSFQDRKEACAVFTDHGQLSAKKVVDTRPPSIKTRHNGLLQCFYGKEITVDSDIFDSANVRLMHQLSHSNLGIEFIYILPFTKHHALVEFTCFSPTIVDETTLEQRLDSFISTLVQEHKFSILRCEKAVLPMYVINNNHNRAANSAGNAIYAGIAGGAMRASTGYSFVNSVHWAKQCASQLYLKDSLFKKAPIHLIYAVMDSIMLKVMRNDMRFGVIIFEQLFKQVSGDRFARFMLQQANSIDFLAIVWAMPKIPFCKAAWQCAVAKLGLIGARKGGNGE